MHFTVSIYYAFAFLAEDDLFNALRKGGLKYVRANSRLLSAEFCLLYWPCVFCACEWYSAQGILLQAACRQNPNCGYYISLRKAWLPWRAWLEHEGQLKPAIDNADIQWREFREGLPELVCLAVMLSLLVRWATRQSWLKKRPGVVPGSLIRCIVGISFVILLHGAGGFFLLLIVLSFFIAGRLLLGSRSLVPTVWILAMAAIVVKDDRLPLRHAITFRHLFAKRLWFLDTEKFQGLYEWPNSVNLMLLRLVSFVLDWQNATLKVQPGEKHDSLQRYTLINCMSHAFYAPTFIAGPTISFDDFIEQCEQPRTSKTHFGWYILRLAVALLMLEVGTHLYPVLSLARVGGLELLPPGLGAAAVFLILNLMWLKFTIIWRFARAWALADGIDVPENMRRAMCNNFSIVGFWKGWHASFNRWLVRYVYVPLGGRDSRVFAAVLTFLFVAVWHDLEAKLIAWGLLNAGFLSVEWAAGAAWNRHTRGMASTRPCLHRHLAALGGATFIFCLMAVNMIGYSVGVVGVTHLLERAGGSFQEAVWVVAGSFLAFFSAVQLGTELRKLDGTTSKSNAGITVEAEGQVKEY